MADYKYIIAVICERFSDFNHHFKERIQPCSVHNNGYLVGDFLYIRVSNLYDIRGEIFNGYCVCGRWENPKFRNEEYYKIIDDIDVCFS